MLTLSPQTPKSVLMWRQWRCHLRCMTPDDVCINGTRIRLILSHEFEQFGSLHMCAPRKYIGRSGTRTRHPRALSQPRYQWANVAHIAASLCADWYIIRPPFVQCSFIYFGSGRNGEIFFIKLTQHFHNSKIADIAGTYQEDVNLII